MKGNRTQPMSAHTPTWAARGILAQWRGVDLTEQERARTNRTQSSASVMPGLVKKLRLDQRQSEAEIA